MQCGDTVPARVKLNPKNEYLKRMLIAQMDLDAMLLTHKYSGTSFDAIPKFRQESQELRRYTESDSILTFDDNTMTALFGNSLEIASEEEYENWKEFAYYGRYQGKSIDTLYLEEEFKNNYENERNKIKKFFQSFRYRRISKQDTLEDSYAKKVRGILREHIIANPENTFIAHQKCSEALQKGASEYEKLRELESIAEITLTSLQQPVGMPINIERVCKTIRNVMQNSKLSQMGIDYRQRQVTLGSETGIRKRPIIQTISFQEVPSAIEKLQEKYDEAYIMFQSEEDYIREVAKIYADFMYVQPYEDGNKRTATCLLNSMLLSKGILPPPISLVNDEQMVEAFYKVKDEEDYTMLQDVLVSKYRKMKSIMEGDSGIEISEEHVSQKLEDYQEFKTH